MQQLIRNETNLTYILLLSIASALKHHKNQMSSSHDRK